MRKLQRIEIEGNNGGDVFELEQLDDGRIKLKIGHCCVYEINHIVPVEFLTSLLVKAVLDAGGVKEALEAVDWPTEFLTELISKIEKIR